MLAPLVVTPAQLSLVSPGFTETLWSPHSPRCQALPAVAVEKARFGARSDAIYRHYLTITTLPHRRYLYCVQTECAVGRLIVRAAFAMAVVNAERPVHAPIDRYTSDVEGDGSRVSLSVSSPAAASVRNPCRRGQSRGARYLTLCSGPGPFRPSGLHALVLCWSLSSALFCSCPPDPQASRGARGLAPCLPETRRASSRGS